ncbi:MAG: FG-GAP-like repeat-containing protein [Desulfobacteraceae bacterium]|nr:FG-GAP-like repeat-containing protein [Desulfobacteraceae bacterium]
MASRERRGRWVRRWWPGLVLLLIGAGCAPRALAPGPPFAGGEAEGYEAPGTIGYPRPLLKKVAAALKAKGRYRRGPVYGIAMQEALRGLQAERQLEVTGRLDSSTLLALGLDPSLLPRGLPPVAPDPWARSLSCLRSKLIGTVPEPAAGLPPDHSPGRFSPASPLAHAAAAVASLAAGKKSFCTGFLVGPDLLLTAASCIPNEGLPEGTVARFNHQEDRRGRPLPTADYRCQKVLEIDRKLGYALVRVADEPGYDWGYLDLADDLAEAGEPLAVIGHPGGGAKRIFDGCRAEGSSGDGNLGLTCDAPIEMAGAPVIGSRSHQVVGVTGPGAIPAGKRGAVTGSRRLLAASPACEPLRTGGLLARGRGAAGFFLQQRGRLGLLRSRKNGWQSEWLPAAWLGKYHLPGRCLAHLVDVDGNGVGELVLENSHWLGIFKVNGGKPRLHWIAHDRVGTWQLGKDDRSWPGDFNGDGKGDLLVFDGKQVGLLLAKGGRLTGAWRSGPRLGKWRFGPADRFYVGDFDGDGRADVLVRRGTAAAVFRSRGNRLELAWTAAGRVGPWELSSGDEHYVGRFTGGRRSEILTRRDGELALWAMEDGKMEVEWMKRQHLGPWRLGWQDRLLVADFTGDGRDDVLIRSDESIGLLVSSGRSFTTSWLRFDRFPGWDLTPFDRELAGDFNGDGKADLLLLGPSGSRRFLATGSGFAEDKGGQGLVLAPRP